MHSNDRKFTALILDDDQVIVEEVVEVISSIGGVCVSYSNPAECIDYLGKNQRAYDLVIVDLTMPGINGLRFLELASNHFLNSPKQFVMTGLAEINGVPLGSSTTFTLLQKPISISDLKEKVGHHLQLELQQWCPK